MKATRNNLTVVTGLVVALAVSGCETLTVTDFNNPGLTELTGSPTRSAVVTAAQGLMIGARVGIGEFNRYISALGVLGRESYIFDGSDPRFITELLQGPLDPGGASFGGSGHWADRYRNVRNANILLAALPAAQEFFTDEELEAIRGFAKTLQAHDLLLVINTRDRFGAPTDVDIEPTGPPASIDSKTDVLAYIVTLLDEAATHLGAAGSTFPFQMSSGFTRHGFDTPAAFAAFNRALKARVQVYQENWNGALTSLAASFLNDAPGQGLAGLDVGVYHAYGTGPGDRPNDLFGRRAVLAAHPSIVTDAQPGDQRLARKTETLSSPVTDPGGQFGLSSDRLFRIYGSLSAPIPLVRNEELLLLRAEANLRSGAVAAARDDINLVRTLSGGLAAIGLVEWTTMTAAQREDELLYNRRYSLLFEGHRWIDMRRYDRLDQLPVDHASFKRFSAFPIPATETNCASRAPDPAGCSQVVGF